MRGKARSSSNRGTSLLSGKRVEKVPGQRGHGDSGVVSPWATETKHCRKSRCLQSLAESMARAMPQIILRWHIQDGNIVIPGSKNPAHIKDNFNLFDFTLTDDEMEKIAALDQQKRYYTSTPEMLKQYAEIVPDVDGQK